MVIRCSHKIKATSPPIALMRLPVPLTAVLDMLRRAYQDGLPKADYYPLLAVLQIDMSEENLSHVVAEFLDDETVVVANDAAKAASLFVPSPEEAPGCAVDWRLPGGNLRWKRTKAERRSANAPRGGNPG